jgi:hypothetical protein
VFALGIGAQAGYVGGGAGGALTFKLDTAPWVFAVNVDRLVNPLSIGGTADMWLANKNFAGPFNYYYGWGVAAGLNIYDSGLGLYAGARALAGINVFVLDKFLEFYLQAAWQPGIDLRLGNNFAVEPVFVRFPVNLGFRFWF